MVKLTYFKVKGKVEAVRVALFKADPGFEDVQVTSEQWKELKPTMPMGVLPVLEVDGQKIQQGNAILRYAGKKSGLYPTDDLKALRVDELLDSITDAQLKLYPSFALKEGEEKTKARQDLYDSFFKGFFSGYLSDLLKLHEGKFLLGEELSISDLALYYQLQWFKSGLLDGFPTDFLDHAPVLKQHYQDVENTDVVKNWENRNK